MTADWCKRRLDYLTEKCLFARARALSLAGLKKSVWIKEGKLLAAGVLCALSGTNRCY